MEPQTAGKRSVAVFTKRAMSIRGGFFAGVPMSLMSGAQVDLEASLS
jgi:hypothetical protein